MALNCSGFRGILGLELEGSIGCCVELLVSRLVGGYGSSSLAGDARHLAACGYRLQLVLNSIWLRTSKILIPLHHDRSALEPLVRRLVF